MKSIDKNAEARQLWLRQIQGLPLNLPNGCTVVRQSDFERSRIWRAVFIAAAVVVGIATFQPPTDQFQAPASLRVTA